MAEMQKVIEAEDSDLFDVLAYVAFALQPLTRAERAKAAQSRINTEYADYKKLAFLDFVLGQYVKAGVGELDQDKLPPLLKLKYHALADAAQDLGSPEQIRGVFVGFQKFLYQSQAH